MDELFEGKRFVVWSCEGHTFLYVQEVWGSFWSINSEAKWDNGDPEAWKEYASETCNRTKTCKLRSKERWVLCLRIYLFSFIFTLFTIDLKLLIYTKKSFCSLYSNNIELIDINSVTEQEMQSFPNQFFKSMWTSWQTHTHTHTHTHLYTHSSKHHSRKRLYSCAVSFLVFTV